MLTVYGADRCEHTRRSLRHLRRLGVPHRYRNVEDDPAARQRASTLAGGRSTTPVVDLGLGGKPLVAPDTDALTGAAVEAEMLTQEQAGDLLGMQNVGDLERAIRVAVGAALVIAAVARPGRSRWPLGIAGGIVALEGLAGWCAGFHLAGVTSIGGPLDRPAEAERRSWLAPRPSVAAPEAG